MPAGARFGPLARRAALVLAAMVSLALILAVAIHVPWIQARVATWAAARLEAGGILVRTRSFSFNAATRRIHAEGLVVATIADPQHPFLEAARLDVALPRSVWTGRFAVASLDGDGVRVMLLRSRDGSTNFPQGQATGASTLPAALPVGALTLPNISLLWRDEVLGAGVTVDAVSIALHPTAGGALGTATLTRPATFRMGDHETSVAGEARVSWNGARLAFESLRLDASEATLIGSATTTLLGNGPSLAVDASGNANLDRLSAWFVAEDRPAGKVAFRAHVTGSVASPVAEVTLTSENLAWRRLTGVAVSAAIRVDRSALDAAQVIVSALGGTATGRAHVSFVEAPEQARASLDWRDLDAVRLLGALGQKAPVRIETMLEGRATASLTAWRLDALTAEITSTSRPAPTNPSALGLSGTLTVGARNGQWHGTIDQWVDRAVRVTGRGDGRLAAGSLAASTVTATIAGAAESLPELWRTLRALGLVGDTPPSTLTGGAHADVTLSGRIGNPRLAGRVEATLPAIDELRGFLPPNLWPSGGLSASAVVSGTATDPTLKGVLSGGPLVVAGQHADRLEAAWNLTPRTLSVEPLVLTQPEAQLTVAGRYDFHTREVSAHLTAGNLALGQVPGTRSGDVLVPLRARLSGELQMTGTFADPRGSGRLDLAETTAFDRDVGRVSTQLTLADHHLHAAIDLVDLSTTGGATIGLASPGAFVIDAQTTDADLDRTVSRLRVRTGAAVTGAASLTAHAEGVASDPAHVHGTVALQRIEARVGQIPVRLTEPARASYDGRTLDVAGVSLDIGGSRFHAEGRLGADAPGTLAASLDGEARDMQQIAVALLPAGSTPAELTIDGHVHLGVRAPGSLQRPAITAEASLDAGHIVWAGEPPATGLVARLSYDAGIVTVSRLETTWQAATVSATGEVPVALVVPGAPVWATGESRVPQPGAGLQVRVDSITPAVLAPFVPPTTVSQLAGLISGTVTLVADRPALRAVRGQIVLDRLDLAFAGVPFAEQQPTRVDVADGHLEVVAWDWRGAGNHLSVGGRVQFDGTPSLDLSLDGTIDMRALGAFFPEVTTGGTARLVARATGAPANPQFDGHVDLEHGELRMLSPRIVASELAGRVVLSRDQVTVSDVKGEANGGTIALAGVLNHSRLRPTNGRLAITGRSLAMAVPEALKTEANLDLALVFDRGDLSLVGDATVLGGSYREPISLATGLLGVLQPPPELIQLETPSVLDRTALDIHLTTSEDIDVDNNYGHLALFADLRLGGTVARPALLGRAEAREGGRIFLGGNVYQVVGSGAIDFSDPARIVPDLGITAVTRVGGYQVTLSLKGPPATLETTLTSEPALTQGEIVSLLVTGQTQNTSALAISSDQVIGYLSGEVLGVTGRALGLDTLRIERGQDVRYDAGLVASETDPASRLTFGKQVTRTVEVVFSQSLRDSGKLTWIVGYRPRPTIELRVVSEDNESRIYDFRHDVTIGGRPMAASQARAASPVVASVKFTGTPGLPETALRRTLRLTEGDRFDFFRWQQDRDRLEMAVRGDDHFEAHVASRRSAEQTATAAAVSLTYEVSQGPRTIVDLSGIPRDETLQRELERLWEQTVFDGFLKDEARHATRARMIGNGYLRAVVTTSLESRDGDKHLVVAIQPGPRSTSWRVVFSGQQHVSADRLEALVSEVNPSASPWADSAPLVRAVTAMYRNEGFLDASVIVGPPVFDGEAATLPVAVNEGPQFRLDAVVFAGARSRSSTALAQVFPLGAGAPLTRAAADDAVQTLMNSYRADGFNAVRVTLTSQAIHASGLVALTVSVDEGPRQVLSEVSIEGARRTSPALVRHELRLEADQPVNRAAWAQARKRLYDTGVFRQVDIQAVPIGEAPSGTPPPAEQPIRARVTLDEWPPLRVRYGLEIDDTVTPASETRTLRPGVAADATYRNLFGRAASTGLALRYTKDFEAARSFFTTPSFLGLPLISNVFLARSREHLGGATARPFLTDESTFTAEQRFKAGRRLQVAYSYSFQRNHTFDANAAPDDPFKLDITVNVGRLTATALVDTRDDLVDATRGRLLSSTFEYGAAALGSDVRFAKYFLQHNDYRALGHGVVVATSGRLGLAAGYGQELILSERFYAGGGNSVRGFKEGSIGPIDALGDPAGGNALVVLSGELRFPVIGRLRGVGFLDAGNAFATIGDLDLSALRAGTGVGLRVQTPFALLRVDVGTPLARRPGESRARWFFSIGQSF